MHNIVCLSSHTHTHTFCLRVILENMLKNKKFKCERESYGSTVSGKHLSHFAHTQVWVTVSVCLCMRTVFNAYSYERMLIHPPARTYLSCNIKRYRTKKTREKEHTATTYEQTLIHKHTIFYGACIDREGSLIYYYDRFKLKRHDHDDLRLHRSFSFNNHEILFICAYIDTHTLCLLEKSESALSWI